ncbi:FKBP-type peptidyl-prolyl cis-trans isomerase [Taibaiella koreensis]|uniref:FKBP-type peptidyl-prolyl cis-trans isomerase n=1 Tax=Taibaiella koreensis TaxID=1268548 RepID=UPI000E59E235|nr:FKBP-type peptidyl-prolyl cis-trans isomerase [Taibaiella koreensis]
MGIADILASKNKEKAEANLKAGEAFLEENKNKEGVVSLPSGLQYLVLKEGEGPKPVASNRVTCHYHGTLIDGKIFDSSVQRGQPATFPLNQVIAGWTEGVQLMSLGSKYRFFIPSALGYGSRQMGSDIGPNSTLIFDVELLGIN